nr:MAG TPA: hypothetical protein [Caudoviricetes sp.]
MTHSTNESRHLFSLFFRQLTLILYHVYIKKEGMSF